MLASPSSPFGRFEDAVMVGVHALELRSRPARRALLGTLDVLRSGETAAGGRTRGPYGSRVRRSRRLLICLGQSGCRQNGQRE
jgi:hypothetical protein